MQVELSPATLQHLLSMLQPSVVAFSELQAAINKAQPAAPAAQVAGNVS